MSPRITGISLIVLLLCSCSLDGLVTVGGAPEIPDVEEDEPEEDAPGEEPPPKTDEPEPGSSLLLSPRHGQLVGGVTADIPLVIAGRSPNGGEEIEVQVLSDIHVLTSWTTIATTTASTESDGDVDLGYLWSVSVPANLRAAGSWPQGGLFRLRVLADGDPTAVLAHDAEGCIAQTQTTEGARALSCASKKPNGVILVSPIQDDRAFPAYLARKGLGDVQATQLYYAQTDAPATYDEFMARYITPGLNNPSAVYLNNGDLAVGRNIECAEFPDGALTGVACMTGNFGGFSGDPGLNINAALAGFDAGNALGAFAYVAMVYQPSRGLDNTVSFVVFGADGVRVDEAALDTRGDVASIPNNCLNCHGSGSTFDASTGIARGASFLPLDALQLRFASLPGTTLSDQSESMRSLNQLVSKTNLNATTQGILDEMYPGGVDQPGSLMYPSDAPALWSGSAQAAETYRNLIAPSCRGCHMTGSLDFSSEELFRTTGQGAVLSVCDEHSMPNAEVVVRNFWSGPGRAYLVDFFDVANPCEPPAAL
jgi:hypothetical protein